MELDREHSSFGAGMGAVLSARPLYFLCAFWGDKYRHYFETCLYASLRPQLRSRDRFLIACPTRDFNALPEPIRDRCWHEPFTYDADRPVYWNQNQAQKSLYRTCFELKLLASMQSPDQLISQGAVETLLRYHARGYDVVQHTALRQNEQTFLSEVGERRLFTARELADLNVRHLHSECDALHDGNAAQPWLPPLRLWKDGKGNLIVHSFVANPVLMDFAKLKKLNLRCVRTIAVENIFLDKNFRGCRFGLITDSDEYGACSLTPDYPSVWKPRPPRSMWWMKLGLQMSYYLWPRAGWVAFQTPAVWHAGNVKPISTPIRFKRRRSMLAFVLGWGARIYLLHLLPWCARRRLLKKTWRAIRPSRSGAVPQTE